MAEESSRELPDGTLPVVPEHPEWISFQGRFFTKFDGNTYTVISRRFANKSEFMIVICNDDDYRIIKEVCRQTFDIDEENLNQISDQWKFIRDNLPLVMMENLL